MNDTLWYFLMGVLTVGAIWAVADVVKIWRASRRAKSVHTVPSPSTFRPRSFAEPAAKGFHSDHHATVIPFIESNRGHHHEHR